MSEFRQVGGLVVPAERVVERGRRCQNCVSFETGPRAVQHYKACRAAELTANPTSAFNQLRVEGPATPKQGRNEPCACRSGRKHKHCCLEIAEADRVAKAAVAREEGRLAAFARMIADGRIGMCGKGRRPKADGGPEGDFVEAGFLCDRWTGVDGSSAATEGHAIDKLPAELKKDLGDPE